MADGLYTGIALSGKEKVDNSGQLTLLEAEKAAAGQRLAKQKEEEKKKSDLMDYVKKNTVLSQKLKTPYYQRKLANKAYETISGIIDAIEKGEENSWAIAKNGVQQYEVFKNATESADASLFETMKTVKENPYDYAFQDKQVINGKEYNNFYEAISDPYADTEEGIQEIMSKYGGTEYIFQKNDPNSIQLGMPEMLVGYSPTPMADPLETAREIAKQKEMFNMPRVGKTQWIPGTDEGMVSRGFGLSNEGIVSLEEQLYNNKKVRRYYEEMLYKEAQRSNPELTKAEFLKTDWLNQVPQRIHQDVGVPAQSWMDVQGFNEVRRPKEEKAEKSNFEKNYGEPLVSIESAENSIYGNDTYRIGHVYKGSRPPKKPVTIREGTLEYRSGDKSSKPISKDLIKSNVDMTPMGIYFVTDKNNIYFLYKREVETTDELTGDKTKEEPIVSIPFTQSSFNEYAQNVSTSKEDLAESIKATVNANPSEKANELLKLLGVEFGGEGGQKSENKEEPKNPFE